MACYYAVTQQQNAAAPPADFCTAANRLDSFDFTAIPSLNKMLVTELVRGEYISRRENIIALGNSGTGKSHVALALGLATRQRGMSVGFATAAGLVHQLIEVFSQRYERGLRERLSLTINVRASSSPPTCHSRSGRPSSAPGGSPAHCSTVLRTTFTSWN